MAKTLNFTYKDIEYTLEYTRNSIKQMERSGFVAEDIAKKPMTLLPDLFAGAFIAHHRHVQPNVIDEIYANMIDKEGLIKALVEMYNEPIASLMDEPGDKKGNIAWVMNG